MPTNRVRYTKQYRQQIVALARSGRSAAALAREFDPTAETIRRWIRRADLDEGRLGTRTTHRRQTETHRLRSEVERLALERDILLRAAVWFRDGSPLDTEEAFAFVKAHRDMLPVRAMCRVLGSSSSGFYAWMKRPPSARARRDAVLRGLVLASWRNSRRTYGRRRIHADLKAQGESVSQKRVARLMREMGIRVARRRRKRPARKGSSRTTCSTPDLVNRNFQAARPNELWVADITEVPTDAGPLFVAVVIDVWSRLVVGWAAETHVRTELVEQALDMAIRQRRPEAPTTQRRRNHEQHLDMAIRQRRPEAGVVHHSDRGTQYASRAFGDRCRKAGTRLSMGSVGDAYDNAMCESFFATLECELLDRHHFASRAEARMAVYDFMEGFYNPHRRHSALGYESPAAFEQRQVPGDNP